tara:strand:+ start:3957 stop:4556 length:600 start_codon:yes stop_codon:yes gene_type:complete
MTRARDIADLVDANGDVVAGALDNVPASNDASALTTGTLAGARLPDPLPAIDGSNLTGIVSFASGTLMLFQQTAAPTGWTKQTTHNDKALRVVTGSAGSGGSSAFTTAFGTPTVTGTIAGSTGSHTLTISEMPSHNHSMSFMYGGGNNPTTGSDPYYHTKYTNNTGGGGSHSHSLSATFSGGAAAINVEYVDLIIASKD